MDACEPVDSLTASRNRRQTVGPMRQATTSRVILLHPQAPPKPAHGAACNGCGVCCAAEPCPLGVFITKRRHGRCAALLWDDAGQRHHCGAVTEPGRFLGWLPRALARRLALRWISAASGCDADYEAV